MFCLRTGALLCGVFKESDVSVRQGCIPVKQACFVRLLLFQVLYRILKRTERFLGRAVRLSRWVGTGRQVWAVSSDGRGIYSSDAFHLIETFGDCIEVFLFDTEKSLKSKAP